MVHLTRIYTRTGDSGQTRLSDMSLTSKVDPRVAAYGDVDEANSAIGVVLATEGVPPAVAAVLAEIQNELFDLGADLSNPLHADPPYAPLRVTPESVTRLEHWCDELGADLPSLRSFILPGGSLAGAYLHMARTITRRAERSAWHAVAVYGTAVGTAEGPGGVNPVAVQYLNRLSDLLFILTRVVNGTASEVLWVPGGERRGGSPAGRARPAGAVDDADDPHRRERA